MYYFTEHFILSEATFYLLVGQVRTSKDWCNSNNGKVSFISHSMVLLLCLVVVLINRRMNSMIAN